MENDPSEGTAPDATRVEFVGTLKDRPDDGRILRRLCRANCMLLSKSHHKRLAGLLCLFALFGGGVVSPTAHFAYMWAATGNMGTESSETHGTSHDGASAMASAHDHVDTPRLDAAPHHSHELCEYADLLASSAPSVVGSPLVTEPFIGSALLPCAPESYVSSLSVGSISARGPPFLS